MSATLDDSPCLDHGDLGIDVEVSGGLVEDILRWLTATETVQCDGAEFAIFFDKVSGAIAMLFGLVED